MTALNWKLTPFTGVAARELYAILKLRVDVFVVEQNCPYPELDGKDIHQGTRHLRAVDNEGRVVAYARILPPGLSYDGASMGRVVVAKLWRGKGISHGLVERAVAAAQAHWPGEKLVIGAQSHLTAFYESHGFVPISKGYVEDGIPHVDMVLDQG